MLEAVFSVLGAGVVALGFFGVRRWISGSQRKDMIEVARRTGGQFFQRDSWASPSFGLRPRTIYNFAAERIPERGDYNLAAEFGHRGFQILVIAYQTMSKIRWRQKGHAHDRAGNKPGGVINTNYMVQTPTPLVPTLGIQPKHSESASNDDAVIISPYHTEENVEEYQPTDPAFASRYRVVTTHPGFAQAVLSPQVTHLLTHDKRYLGRTIAFEHGVLWMENMKGCNDADEIIAEVDKLVDLAGALPAPVWQYASTSSPRNPPPSPH